MYIIFSNLKLTVFLNAIRITHSRNRSLSLKWRLVRHDRGVNICLLTCQDSVIAEAVNCQKVVIFIEVLAQILSSSSRNFLKLTASTTQDCQFNDS